MGMENNDLLREQAKRLRKVEDQLCCIKDETTLSKAELTAIKTELSTLDYSRTVTLTGSLAALSSEVCQEVTLINYTDNDLNISVKLGATIVIPDKAGITLSVDNANDVRVSGTGVLSYVVSK
jgi:hypothetical protein